MSSNANPVMINRGENAEKNTFAFDMSAILHITSNTFEWSTVEGAKEVTCVLQSLVWI